MIRMYQWWSHSLVILTVSNLHYGDRFHLWYSSLVIIFTDAVFIGGNLDCIGKSPHGYLVPNFEGELWRVGCNFHLSIKRPYCAIFGRANPPPPPTPPPFNYFFGCKRYHLGLQLLLKMFCISLILVRSRWNIVLTHWYRYFFDF